MMKFLLDHAKQLWVLKNQMRINHSILQFLIPIALFSSANNALGQGSVVFSVNDFTDEAYQLHGYNARLDKYGLVNLIKPSNTGLYQRGFHYENFYHDGYLYGIIKQESKVVLGRFDGKTYELIGDLMNNQTIMDLHFTLYKNKIYFIRTISNSYGYTQLVEYDPSTNQTINVSGEAGLSDLNSSSLVVYDDGTGEKLYFGARSSSSQKTALYSFDGQTTRKIDNFNFSTPEEFIVFNDILYVAASPLNTNGDDRLVAYDGESSWQVFESNPGNSSGKDDIIRDFTIFDNKLFWSAYHYDLAYGGINKKVKLFSMDTDENVTFEHVPNPDYTGGPILMTVVNGELFYSSPHTSNIAYDVYKYINSTSAELISDNKVRINGMVKYDDGLFYFPNNPHYIKKDGSGSYINKEIEGASPRFQSNSQQPVVFEGQISPLFYLKEREVTVIGRATEISPQIELHDIDSYSMGSVKVKITSGLDPGDKLTIVSQYGITSNYDADLGELSLNVNSSHTTAQVQDVLRSVRMEGTKEGLRTLLFMGTDAEGNESYLDNEYAKLSANVLVGNFSLLTFPSQPSGMGESTFAGPFLGSFIEEDEILKSVKFKVTDDDTMTPFESLSLAYKEDQYGLFYYDGEIGVSMSIDWESSSYDMTPATLAFKSNDSFNFISFDLRGIDLFNGLDFRVSGKYEGVEKFYFNIDEASNFAGEIIVPNQYVEVEVDEIRISYSGGMGMGMTESYSVDNILFRTLSSYDFDGTLTEGSSINEPVDLPSTLNEEGDHKGIFDFILTDGGGTDGLSMDVSNISFEVSGTAADSTRAKLTYLLNGPDVTDAEGEYDADTEKLTFSNLSISIANGGNEHYTLSAYFNDNTFLQEGNTIILNLDGASGITVSEEGTHMQAGSPLSNGTGSVITVKATGWEFMTQPVGSVSGKALTTQPIIAAMDDFGNIDRDFAAAVELTEASAGTLTNATVEAVNGQAIFTNLTYTATADKQSFILTATTDELDFPAIHSKALIADVLATKLIFTTEPSPLKIYGETAVKFSSVPVVAAVDDQELVDVDYTTNFLLNESGSGKSILTSDGDLDESENSVTLKPVHGQVKFENLTLNYQFKEGFDEDFQLFVSSGTLPLTKSTSINATRDMAEVVKVEVPESKTYGIGDELIIKITFDDPVSVKVDNLPIIRLTVGSQTKIATYQSGENSTTLTFKYIVQEGDMGPGGITILGYEPGSIYQVKNNNPANAALTNIGETKNIHVDGIAPADFLVHFQGGAIVNENVANGTIILEDAEMGSTMHYSFKSTAMTDSIYSSLTVTSIYQQVTGLDLRSIPDGAVELLVWLEDAGGNTGKGKRLSLNKKTNTPPQISKLSLTGDLVIGESLTAKYDFADGEKDDENGTVYEWYRAKTANGTDRTKIDGAFLKVYTLKEADRGYFIQVEVKPGDGQVYGEKVISEYIGAIKASQTITFEPIAERTYGGNTFVLGAKYTDQNKEISYSASRPGLVNITGNSAEIIGAGELIITATQAGDAQTLAADAKTQKLIIQKAPLNISVNSDKKVYGSQDPKFSVAYSGFAGEDTAEDLSGVLTISRESGESVGEYAISGEGLSSANYTINFASGKLEIIPAALEIAVQPASKIYGAQDPEFSVAYSGFVGEDTAEDLSGVLTISRESGESVGEYAISGEGLSSANYTINFASGKLVIIPAALEIAVQPASKVYGAQDPNFSVAYSGFVGEDTAEDLSGLLTISRESGESVGEYAISGEGLSSANYTINFATGKLEIIPAALEIAVQPASKVYGAQDPEFSVAYSGFVGEDTAEDLSGLLNISRESGESVGEYAISGEGLSSANYTINFASGKLEIIPAALEIAVQPASKVYGSQDPNFSVAYSGFVGEDTAEDLSGLLTISRESGESVGEYAISGEGLSSANYTINFASGKLEIIPAALEIAVQPASKVYGAPDPEFSVAYSGFVGEDTAEDLSDVLTISRESGESVGEYAISGEGLSSANYTINFASGKLEIIPAALEIAVQPASKVYGAQDPNFSVAYSGFIGEDTAEDLSGVLTISRESGESVGEYAISGEGLSSANYTISYQTGKLTICPAQLKVKAESMDKIYGTVDPTLSYSVQGLVNGDSPSVISGELERSYGETVGTYPINKGNLSVSENYSLSFSGGTFTIMGREIAEVYPISTIAVDWGSSVAALSLPQEVLVITSHQELINIPVSWNTAMLNSRASGSYTIYGTLQTPSDMEQENLPQAKIQITVLPKASPEDISLGADSFKADYHSSEVLIGEVTITDPVDDQHQMILIEGANDNSLFTLTDGNLYWSSVEAHSGREEFVVTIMVVDAAGNELKKDFTITRLRTPLSDIEIFNTFTPNGDGVNDTWQVPDLQYFTGVRVMIFERSGERLFFTTDPTKGWDGTYRGKAMAPGAYYWVVESTETSEVRKGFLNLLSK